MPLPWIRTRLSEGVAYTAGRYDAAFSHGDAAVALSFLSGRVGGAHTPSSSRRLLQPAVLDAKWFDDTRRFGGAA
jgi:hypothetical protein